MSSQPRGRHRAAKHAKPRARRTPNLQATLGVAGLAAASATGGSSVIHTIDAPSVVALPQAVPTPTTDLAATVGTQLRALAASRSDERTSLSDAQASAAAADVVTTTPADSTPVLDLAARRGLSSVAGDQAELDSLVGLAQAQADDKAASVIAQRNAEAAAATAAQADASAAADAAARAAQLGVRVTPIKDHYRLTARFGQKGGIWSKGWHTGLDFQVPPGTKVYAAAGGDIIEAGWAGAYGNRIQIRHQDGSITTYNHLSKILHDKGWVDAGEEIGLSGSTGNTTGPHLHFEVEVDGKLINPATWLWG